MISDPGVAGELRPDELKPEWFAGCDAIYLSGYSLLRSPADEAVAAAAAAVRELGGLISVDLSTWTSIRAYGSEAFLAKVEELRPDIVFGNEEELHELGREPHAETIVLKRGSAGAIVISGGRHEEHDALVCEVIDTTGAGDALAAGFLVGGIELGLDAAARCVSKLGAMP
jgi:sugar/nucleoside kinase (ribokinase family)